MSDCGGDDGGGGDHGCDHSYDTHTDHHDYSSHGHSYHDYSSDAYMDFSTKRSSRGHRKSNKTSTLPSYEDAVGTVHKGTNHDRSKSKAKNKDVPVQDLQPRPPQEITETALEMYDPEQRSRSIFDAPIPSRGGNIERRNKRNPVWSVLKEQQAAGYEPRSNGMNRCTICMIVSFLLIVVVIILVLTFVKW